MGEQPPIFSKWVLSSICCEVSMELYTCIVVYRHPALVEPRQLVFFPEKPPNNALQKISRPRIDVYRVKIMSSC